MLYELAMEEIIVRTEGRVKRIEYLLYLANVRAEEQQALDLGYRITRKSIEEIREEFQAKYGSIWMEI